MRSLTRDWLAGLREFVACRRETEPPMVTAGPAGAAERMILATAIANRLGAIEDIRAARRAGLAGVADPDPAFVVTTSPVGIVATNELLATHDALRLLGQDAVVPVTELEYRLWCIRNPDEGHLRHVNLWSWVKTAVPRQRWPEFSRHPLAAGDTYWLHREGVAGAGAADRRDCHLWRWNGSHAALLEAFIRERAAPRLGAAGSD